MHVALSVMVLGSPPKPLQGSFFPSMASGHHPRLHLLTQGHLSPHGSNMTHDFAEPLSLSPLLPRLELVVGEQWLRKLCLFQVTPHAWNTITHLFFFYMEVAGIVDCADGQDRQKPEAWSQVMADGVTSPNSSTTPIGPHGEWRGGVYFPALDLDLGLGLRS